MRQRLLCLLLSGVLVVPLISGCAERVYDPDHHDYHRWNGHEREDYTQWENQTHRGHEDYDRRSQAEQREYWNWRHSHH